ncbi:Elongator complex protein 5 [Nakaseomyces bracarensis]|uniref:Elongator complex protein 5 n=1 Tax=Nakaseomyces bracarensis TaxID=273131 RepID=A0ABR4NRX5_9SACH
MASSTHNPSVLLKRILSLTDPVPLLLFTDTLAQSSQFLVQEVVHNVLDSQRNKEDNTIIYVGFDEVNKPKFADVFVDVSSTGFTRLSETISSYLPTAQTPVKSGCKNLVVIDSLNHIPRSQLSQFIASIASPHATIVATFHRDMVDSKLEKGLDNYPSAQELLGFMATTVIDIDALPTNGTDEEDINRELGKFNLLRGLNNKIFSITLTNKRRSGRSLNYDFKVDPVNHQYTLLEDKEEDNSLETPEMLQDLATFNLSTSEKQKKARDLVDLPFLEAQSLTTGGTAIVYEYEKDDDYDEEDPYEDPF